MDILHSGYKKSQSINFALRVYDQMTTLLPAAFANDYGTGEEAARRGLTILFKQQLRPVNSYIEPNDVVEAIMDRGWDYDRTEYANATSTRDELTGKLPQVLAKVLNVREERRKTVTAWTIETRTHALGVAKAGKGEKAHLPMYLSGLLGPVHLGYNATSPWSKADFVSGCVGLRAAAKTYLDECSTETRNTLLRDWKAGVSEFLLEGDQVADDEHKWFRDGDFHVKFHAALLLDNLTRGPKDEISQDLFDVERWIL